MLHTLLNMFSFKKSHFNTMHLLIQDWLVYNLQPLNVKF